MKNFQLDKEKYSERLIKKINADLEYGFKVFGGDDNKADVIRVWTRNRDKEFALVLTSSIRFAVDINFVEIQSFSQSGGIKMTLLLKDAKRDKLEVKVVKLSKLYKELDDEDLSESEFYTFLTDYLNSWIDKELIKRKFESHFYNKKQYQWLRPEEYK